MKSSHATNTGHHNYQHKHNLIDKKRSAILQVFMIMLISLYNNSCKAFSIITTKSNVNIQRRVLINSYKSDIIPSSLPFVTTSIATHLFESSSSQEGVKNKNEEKNEEEKAAFKAARKARK